jgi:hypothetical protein
MAKSHVNCPLPDCKERPSAGVGLSAHIRGHILRGEAKMNGEMVVRVPEVPLAIGQYERKQRMDAIHAGTIKADMSFAHVNGKKRGRKPKIEAPEEETTELANVEAPKGQFDLSKLSPDQINALRAQLDMPTQEVELVEEHSCPTTRAIDRMKNAIVMTTVAEMLEHLPADQMLVMLTQMGRMPKMSRR